ncbi:MAG: glycosyltransferase family 2 protein [Bacteroidetes bacterium]|nr:glycosyltransferase family 2 protein [Bacteroidota bacterium]
MPVYNTGKYLAAAIASVLGQTFSDFELIILNDGSTDDSETVVKNFTDPRIIYLKNERNLGLIATLNTALSQCKGEFIARMDGDDICHSERLAAQLRFLNAHPEISVCGTFFYSLEKKSRTKKYLPESSYEISAEMFFRCPVAHPSVMIRSAVVKKYNLRYSRIFLMQDLNCGPGLVMNGEKLANVLVSA